MTDENTAASLKVRTKLSAAEQQANFERSYDAQTKQYCFQQALQIVANGGVPKDIEMGNVLREADSMYQWFKNGTVPARPVQYLHAVN